MQARASNSREVDGWNRVEIIARGDAITHILNGVTVNEGCNVRCLATEAGDHDRPVSKGRIALEIEAAEVFFRNIVLRPIQEP